MHKRVGENKVGCLDRKGVSIRSDIEQQVDVYKAILIVSVLRFVSAPEGVLYLLGSVENIYWRKVSGV